MILDSLNTVKEAIFQFIAWVKTQFGYSVKVMQSDLDRALGKEFVAKGAALQLPCDLFLSGV